MKRCLVILVVVLAVAGCQTTDYRTGRDAERVLAMQAEQVRNLQRIQQLTAELGWDAVVSPMEVQELRYRVDALEAEIEELSNTILDLSERQSYIGTFENAPKAEEVSAESFVPKPADEEPVVGAEEGVAVESETEESANEYLVIEEWGRTAEEAKQLGDDVSSLKGMYCVVPGNSSDEFLVNLARSLRNKFSDFDNINIQVFDNEQAARDYAQKSVVSTEHHVLAISKHRTSGRDLMLLLRRGKPTEILP